MCKSNPRFVWRPKRDANPNLVQEADEDEFSEEDFLQQWERASG